MSPEKDAPPSYNEATTSPPPSLPPSSNSIASTLSSLTHLLRTTQAQQSALTSITTTSLLPLLTPHLTTLLTNLATSPNPPSLAELIFVPAAAVAPSWTISTDLDRRAGQLAQVIRVEAPRPPDSKSCPPAYTSPDTGDSGSSSREFDEWGRWEDETTTRGSQNADGQWWWDDELLARRIARRLQPEPHVDRTVTRTVVQQAREERKAARWGGLFKSPAETSSPAKASKNAVPGGQEDDVTMTIRAEEVTFRKENEMGLWETTRGYGIVARVRIRR
ncbi:hypothetical protein C8034_v003713 [Colletotrichum sidae]|uniref:Nad dependent epimerase dehydratase family protein n=1 Tax=Colletotrichum sidae TaxID=1347389 RepID=A0A4R8T9E9_9PEZI|nr:hypothetical protein C8034_v003713 [Colletotrichum sidae]